MTENEPTTESQRPGWGLWLGLAGLFLLAFGLRWVHLQAAQDSPYPAELSFMQDSQYYAEWSEQIAEGQWVGKHSFFMGPLYPYSLAAISFLAPESPAEGYDYFHAYLIQAFFSSLGCLLLFGLTRRWLGIWQGFLVGVLAALQPVLLYFDGLLMPSSQVLFTVILTLWLLERAQRLRRLGAWCATGVAIGLATLAKGPALLLLPGVLLWILVGERDAARGLRMRWAAGVLFSCVPVVGLATLHNYLADGDLVLVTSNAGNNLWIGNGPDASGAHAGVSNEFPSSKLLFYRFNEDRPADEPPASEVSRILSARARQYMLDHPAEAAGMLWRKFRMFWNRVEVGTTDQFEYFKRYSPVLGLPVASFGWVVPLGLVGLLVGLKRWRRFWPLYLVVATQCFSYTTFFVLGRYRLPTIACMMVFAAVFLDWLLRALRNREFQRLLPAGLALVLAVVLVHTPVEGMTADRGFANQEFLLAQTASKRGEDPRPHYQAALDGPWREGDMSLRQKVMAHLLIGDAYAEAGARKKARVLFRRGLEAAEAMSEWNRYRPNLIADLRGRLQALDGQGQSN